MPFFYEDGAATCVFFPRLEDLPLPALRTEVAVYKPQGFYCCTARELVIHIRLQFLLLAVQF